jgi:hypothetical protein
MPIITHESLRQALRNSIKPAGGPSNGGLDNHMWAAVVNRRGVVRAVCYSGNELGDQWPGSRAIAIEKANTANALSLPSFAFPPQISMPVRSRAAFYTACWKPTRSIAPPCTEVIRRLTARPTIR